WARLIRWQYLLAPVGRTRFRNVFRTTVLGFAPLALLPARAGDVIPPYLLCRQVGSPGVGDDCRRCHGARARPDCGAGAPRDLRVGLLGTGRIARGVSATDRGIGGDRGGSRGLTARAHVDTRHPPRADRPARDGGGRCLAWEDL